MSKQPWYRSHRCRRRVQKRQDPLRRKPSRTQRLLRRSVPNPNRHPASHQSHRLHPNQQPEPQPTEPACDVSRYVSYAKSYGSGIGLTLDSSATGCWDTPIEAHAGCIYLERDIRDCLIWYKASGYTAFWVWSVDAGGGNYEIYIGYA